LAFIAGLAAGLAFGFMHLPAFAQALGFGQPGQGFIFFHLSKNSACIVRSYLLQTVISKGDTDMARYALQIQTQDHSLEEPYHHTSSKAKAIQMARHYARYTPARDVRAVYVFDTETGYDVFNAKVSIK
jgi:hypothetical protein